MAGTSRLTAARRQILPDPPDGLHVGRVWPNHWREPNLLNWLWPRSTRPDLPLRANLLPVQPLAVTIDTPPRHMGRRGGCHGDSGLRWRWSVRDLLIHGRNGPIDGGSLVLDRVERVLQFLADFTGCDDVAQADDLSV